MTRNCLISTLFACSVAWSANDQNPFLLFETSSPKPAHAQESPIEVIQRITNTTGETIESDLQFEWNSDLPDDYFDILKDGRPMQRKLAEVDFVRKKTTTLEPGESVTVAFSLDRLTWLPEPSKRAGIYRLEVQKNACDEGGTGLPLVAPSDLWLIVLDAVPERPLPISKPLTKDHLPLVRSLLQADATWPADRLRILEMVAETKENDLLWQAVMALLRSEQVQAFEPEDWHLRWHCKDVYAVVSILPKLPKELLDPGYLFVLCRTTDLALRRAALEAMARAGPEKRVATRLSEFLAHQNDEIVLELGKKALSALEAKPLK